MGRVLLGEFPLHPHAAEAALGYALCHTSHSPCLLRNQNSSAAVTPPLVPDHRVLVCTPLPDTPVVAPRLKLGVSRGVMVSVTTFLGDA